MNALKFLLLYIVIIIIFLFTKITKFSYDFTGLLLSTVFKQRPPVCLSQVNPFFKTIFAIYIALHNFPCEQSSFLRRA